MSSQKGREENPSQHLPSEASDQQHLEFRREPLAKTIDEISQAKHIPQDQNIKNALNNHNVVFSATPKTQCTWKDFKVFEDDVKADHDKYPETVSKFWIPLNKMKEIAPFNQNFQRCVEMLKVKYAGWKKSRGDGNCYYRAVMYSFLEKLLKPHYDTNELEKFLLKLKSEQKHEILQNFSQFQIFLECKNVFIQYLEYFLQLKHENPVTAFLEFLKYSLEKNFDQSMIMTGRLLCAEVIASSDERIREFFYENAEMTAEKILIAGEEAADLELSALPIALGTQVVQYSIFNSVLENRYPEEKCSSLDPVSIIRRSGHYDILYTKQELETEQYSLEEGKYHFLLSN